MSAALVWLVLLGSPATEHRYNQLDMKDMEAMAGVLKKHVAEISVQLNKRVGFELEQNEREGYGIVLEPRLVACLHAVVEDAKSITITGPKGRVIPAELVLHDPVRRVALLRTASPVTDTGLTPARVTPKAERKVEDQVFALISTQANSGVVYGVLTDSGEQQEYEGHPRIDLLLTRGMPVFDDRARFVGYSRVVAWDADRFMLITPEMIQSARTATGAASHPKSKARGPEATKKPWWSK